MYKDNFESVAFVLGADVANGAAFTVNYPAGYSAGDFSGAAGHYLVVNGQELRQPKHVGLAWGAGLVTVTNNTGDTLKAGSTGAFQFEVRGHAILAQVKVPGGKGAQNVQATGVKGVLVDFGSPAAISANGIFAAKPASNAASKLTVADFAASANGGVFDVPRNITLVGDGAGANNVVTALGLDSYGQLMQESFTLVDGTTVQGKKAFASVYEFDVAAGAAGHTFSAGWGKVFGLPIRVNDARQIIGEQIDNAITEVRDVKYTFQHTEAETDAGTPRYLSPQVSGYLVDAGATSDNVITTGGALTYAVGVTAVTGLAPTFADGAIAGNSVKATPTGDGTEYFLATDFISVTPAAAFNASAPLNEFFTYRRTNGKLALGLDKNTAATAVNADVRGTWTPNTNPDGAHSFALILLASEAYDIGNDQYTP